MLKKAAAVCLAVFLIMIESACGASGLFPTTSEMFGTAMPSVALTIGRDADETQETEEGKTEIFLRFGADEYIAFGQYLAGVGATVDGYEIDETAVDIRISARGGRMSLTYDWKEQKGTAVYPAGTRPEAEKEQAENRSCLLPPVGGILPSVEFAVGRKPDETKQEKGQTVQIYSSFTDEDYAAFSRYLGQSGASLQETKIESGLLSTAVHLNGAAFTFTYDWNRQTAQSIYPEGTRPESCSWVMNEKAGSLLPSIEKIGQELPSLYMAIGREPDTVSTDREGSTHEVYSGFTDGDYDAFSQYLSQKNCKVDEYRTEQESRLIIQLSNASGKMTFTYDAVNHEGRVAYPANSRWEKTWPITRPTVAAGDIVTFGHYEQEHDLSNGSEPIEWIVLAAEDENVLLLSKYGLDAKPYHDRLVAITWEECALRSWLNTDFLQSAFTSDEQSAILLTNVDNSEEQGYKEWKTNGGNDTQDRVFLLSYKEAFGAFFGDDSSRICQATPYAIMQRAYTSESGNCRWWLRSPGDIQSYAAYVFRDGSRSHLNVNFESACIRPAFWLNLDSEIVASGSFEIKTEGEPEVNIRQNTDQSKPENESASKASAAKDLSEEEYNKYAALFIGTVKGTLKNPDSLDVHWIKVMEYQNDMYIVFNYSAMNGFGGYNRNTWSFKFEPGYISLSGDASDYNAYENHSNEFYEYRSLSVDDVMKIVNR